MSQSRKISDCVFTTPVDDQYDEHSGSSYEGFNNLESIISGIKCLMTDIPREEFEEASTNSSSPFEEKSIFSEIDKVSFFEEMRIARKQKIKLSKCVKKNWKTKILKSRELLCKSLISKVNTFNSGMLCL
jgi:hypothetical protein